jgi:hypothetical protein
LAETVSSTLIPIFFRSAIEFPNLRIEALGEKPEQMNARWIMSRLFQTTFSSLQRTSSDLGCLSPSL